MCHEVSRWTAQAPHESNLLHSPQTNRLTDTSQRASCYSRTPTPPPPPHLLHSELPSGKTCFITQKWKHTSHETILNAWRRSSVISSFFKKYFIYIYVFTSLIYGMSCCCCCFFFCSVPTRFVYRSFSWLRFHSWKNGQAVWPTAGRITKRVDRIE